MRLLDNASSFLLLFALVAVSCSGRTTADPTPSPDTTADRGVASTSTTTTMRSTTTSLSHESGSGTGASADAPLALGRVAEVGDWRLRVNSVIPDATEILLESEFNEAPAEGHLFFMAELEATYIGEETSDFWIDVFLGAVGETGVQYQPSVDSCGFVPQDINQTSEVFPGGTIIGNVCWAVVTEDAGSLILIAEEFFAPEGDQAFLSLDATANPVQESTSSWEPVLDRSSAVPYGETASIGDWDVRIVSVIPDATQIVLSEADFNSPPTHNHQYFIASLEATYTGTGSASFFLDHSLNAVGDSSVTYDEFGSGCGFIPEDIGFSGEAPAGGTITGNVCWEVRSADVDSLVLLVGEFRDPERPSVMLSLTE